MTSKIIKQILKNKIDKWIESIKDERVRDLASKNTIVTGGAIASMLLKEEVKDFDIYFRNKETVLAVAQYYATLFNTTNNNDSVTVVDISKQDESVRKREVDQDRIKMMISSRGVVTEDGSDFDKTNDVEDVLETETKDDEQKPRFRPIFISSNAITLSEKVQIVVRFFGEPEVIHTNYDFTHCINFYDHGKNALVLNVDALECLLTKQLKYQGSKYPLCSLIRTRKFIKRGFSINAGQYVKMAFQIHELDLKDPKVLEDQLTGVDSAYFIHLLDALTSKIEADKDFKISAAYVIEIIDRIF